MEASNKKTNIALFAAVMFLCAAVGRVLYSYLAAYLYQAYEAIPNAYDSIEIVLSLCYYTVFCLLPVVFVYKKSQNPISTLCLSETRFTHLFIAATTAAVCVLLANELAILWTILFESVFHIGFPQAETPALNTSSELVRAIITYAALPGFFEEIFFRGMIQNCIPIKNTKLRVVLTATLFAFLHMSPGGFLSEVVVGIILGYLTLYTGSVWTSAVFHMLYNTGVLLMVYLVGASEVEGTYLSAVGGIGGVISMCVSILLQLVIVNCGFRVLKKLSKQPEGNTEVTGNPNKIPVYVVYALASAFLVGYTLYIWSMCL